MFCWFFRFMISSATDSGSAIDRWTSRHVAHCASCGQFLQSCRTIDVRLRSEAAGWQRGSEQPAHPILPNFAGMQLPSHSYRIHAALAAAACLAITAAVMLSLTMPARQPEASAPTMTAIIPASTPWATKWAELIKNPLAVEAENLTSDTESSIRFLVACLDVRPLGTGIAPHPSEPGASPLH